MNFLEKADPKRCPDCFEVPHVRTFARGSYESGLPIAVFARSFNTYEIGFQIRDYQSEKNHEPSYCDTAFSPNNSWFAVQHIRSFPGKIR